MKSKVNMKKVWKIFKGIKKENLIDDRREYDIEDLEKAYRISESDAKFLFSLIKKEVQK